MNYKKIIFTIFVISVVIFAGAKLVKEYDHGHDDHSGHVHDADGNHIEEDHTGHDHDEVGHADHQEAGHDEDAGHDHAHDADGNHIEEDHTGHDHDGDGHADHDEAGHAEDEDHEGHDHASESLVEISKEDVKRFGIEVGKAGAGRFDLSVAAAGEIKLNENKVAHIVPTVPGIVRQIVKDMGDKVAVGEIIAWIESTEVGGAKLDFLAKQAEVSCCSIELVRIQEIHDNTLKLLGSLKGNPSLEDMLEMDGSAMGMNRSRLVSSYAEFVYARETYLREKDLYEKKISSKEDFLKAQSVYKKGQANYAATRDSINFEIKRDLLEAQRLQQTMEIELLAAKRLLFLHGLTTKDVEDISFLAKNQNLKSKENDCTDPNCKECTTAAQKHNATVADISIANEKISWYPIRSPFDGTIIDKHITLGELVKDDVNVFVIADLDTVWVDLRIHQKDAALVKKGQTVKISAKHVPVISGVIDCVVPVLDEKTRTGLARIVLDNKSGIVRPGMFVSAEVTVDSLGAKLVVDKDILQEVNDATCVFVQDDHGFEARQVTVGRKNGTKVEILSGLKAGQYIVTSNAFRLKAELEKGEADAHAGHSH